MASTYLCNICQDSYPIVNLRSLPCGHTNCAKCIATYTEVTRSTRGTYPCPSCRKAFKAAQSHPIFLELVDSASQAAAAGSGRVCHPDSLHKQIASALQEITRVEEDLQHKTVQRAAQEMEKVSEMMDTRDCLLNLVAAVAARWRGMLPLFSTIASQRKDILKLNGNLREAKAATEKAERIADEAVKTSEQTIPTLRKTQSELREAKIKLDQLEQRMVERADEYKDELKRKNEEVGRLHTQLQALKAQELKQKEEIRKLREKVKPKARRVESSASSSQYRSVIVEESQNELEILLSESQESWDGVEERSNSGSTLKRKRISEDVDFVMADADSAESVFALSQYLPQHPRPPPLRPLGLPPIRPTFDSGWHITSATDQARLDLEKVYDPPSTKSSPFAIKLDAKGKPLVPVQVGSRRRAKF